MCYHVSESYISYDIENLGMKGLYQSHRYLEAILYYAMSFTQLVKLDTFFICLYKPKYLVTYLYCRFLIFIFYCMWNVVSL
jgi:hypothetical protein